MESPWKNPSQAEGDFIHFGLLDDAQTCGGYWHGQPRTIHDLYRMAHPTDEHYLPLLYILAQRRKGDVLRYFNADFDLGTLSMRSFILSEG